MICTNHSGSDTAYFNSAIRAAMRSFWWAGQELHQNTRLRPVCAVRRLTHSDWVFTNDVVSLRVHSTATAREQSRMSTMIGNNRVTLWMAVVLGLFAIVPAAGQ